MNRSFLIVGVPAVLTSFGWLWFTWGLKLAGAVTAAEIVLIVAFVIFVLRRQGQKNRTQLAKSAPGPAPKLRNPGE